MELSVLERKDLTRVLRTVAENPGCTQNRITPERSLTVFKRIDELEALGLIRRGQGSYRGNPTHTFTLTREGEILWSILKTIELLPIGLKEEGSRSPTFRRTSQG